MGRDDGLRGKNGAKHASGSGKWSRYADRTVDKPVQWADVDAEQLRAVINSITKGGDAILFSRTAAGDCLGITVCSGEERLKVYARSVEQCEEELANLENFAQDTSA